MRWRGSANSVRLMETGVNTECGFCDPVVI